MSPAVSPGRRQRLVVVVAHPESPLAWAVLAEAALSEGTDDVAASTARGASPAAHASLELARVRGTREVNPTRPCAPGGSPVPKVAVDVVGRRRAVQPVIGLEHVAARALRVAADARRHEVLEAAFQLVRAEAWQRHQLQNLYTSVRWHPTDHHIFFAATVKNSIPFLKAPADRVR